MIRLSKLADYGIVMTTRLALYGGQESTQELAQATGVPQPMASKILKALTRAGLLHSTRGARGGYELARPASEVTVAQVVEALEGPIAITDCVEEGCGCGLEVVCPAKNGWQRINDAIREALGRVTLEEMAQSAPAGFVVPEPRQPVVARSA